MNDAYRGDRRTPVPRPSRGVIYVCASSLIEWTQSIKVWDARNQTRPMF